MIYPKSWSSPLYRLDRLSDFWEVDLFIKRDDLIPQYLGGNKARKNSRIVERVIRDNGVPDVIITNGGINSNHARVVALICAQIGARAHLVLHGRAVEASSCLGNALFSNMVDASCHYVESDQISCTIANLCGQAKDEGQSILVIPGGGHSLEGAEAYAEAVNELPFIPDVIVHASGTGGTQAGLILGVARREMITRVIGISIARDRERGRKAIAELLPAELSLNEIEFFDDFRIGGYERTSPELLEFLKFVLKLEGLPLDPTYTGKAMYGLSKLIEQGLIEKHGRIVFWHTGGLLNLLSGSFGGATV